MVAVIAAGLWRAGSDYRATADSGAALLFALLASGVVQWFSELDLALPSFPAFLTACALCRTAFFAPGSPEPEPSPGGES